MDPEDDSEEYEDYEDSESEAITLTCVDERNELQVAAHAAFGTANGKGEARSKFKRKGKVVKSQSALEQRRDNLSP